MTKKMTEKKSSKSKHYIIRRSCFGKLTVGNVLLKNTTIYIPKSLSFNMILLITYQVHVCNITSMLQQCTTKEKEKPFTKILKNISSRIIT